MVDVFRISATDKMKVCRHCTKHFREIRKRLGLSQDELADVLGTTQRRISEIETGKAQVSWTLFLAFSAVVSLEFDFEYHEEEDTQVICGFKNYILH